MVSNVDRIYVTRRSRSRTPSRVATPQVKKVNKPAKKKAPVKRASTRGRSKTPTRTITASTPKPKASAKKPTSAKSTEKITRKRKSIVLHADEDDDDDTDYPVKKNTPTPKSAAKPIGRPKKSPTSSVEKIDNKVRRSRRLRDQNVNTSISEHSGSRKESKALRDLSINGGINTSQNETLINEEQGRKWGWFSCAIM